MKPEALSHPVKVCVLPAIVFETFFRKNPVFLAQPGLPVANIDIREAYTTDRTLF